MIMHRNNIFQCFTTRSSSV